MYIYKEYMLRLQCLTVALRILLTAPFCLYLVVQNRGRLAEKRTIPLPPNRVPKKELSSIFSSDDSEGSERASGDHAHIKQEEELHYSIMRKR